MLNYLPCFTSHNQRHECFRDLLERLLYDENLLIFNGSGQVVKPSTQEKVHMEGDNYMNNLATHLGGIFNVPVVLGGKCSCDFCDKVRTHKVSSDMSLVAHRARAELEQLGDQELALEERAYSARLSMYQSYSGTLQLLIGGLFLLWIVVSMLSGYYDSHIPPT